MEPTVPVVELEAPPSITENPDFYPTGKYITKQVADLEIQVSVTEYRSQIYRSRNTGERYHAPSGAFHAYRFHPWPGKW